MKINRLFTTIILTAFLISCKIGNFMDMGDYDDNPLFLYALTINELIAYEIDTDNGTLSEMNRIGMPSIANSCKLVYEKEKDNLYVSHGTDPYYISAYDIKDDGDLDIIGSPYSMGSNSVFNFIFDSNKSFLFALAGPFIYGFEYLSDGSIVPTAQATLNEFTGGPTADLVMYDGYLFKHDANPWRSYTIDSGTGFLSFFNEPAPPVDAAIPGAAITSGGYLYKLSGGIPNNIYSYSLDIPANTSSQISNQTFGSVSLSTNNSLIRDPESRFLYFVSDTDSMIYGFRTNTDGTVGAIIDTIATGPSPNAAAADPYKQFFFTASTDGSGGYQINIHRMNNDLPENTYDNTGSSVEILELLAVRGDN